MEAAVIVERGALGPAGADQRAQFVDEEYHVASPADLVHDRFDES